MKPYYLVYIHDYYLIYQFHHNRYRRNNDNLYQKIYPYILPELRQIEVF